MNNTDITPHPKTNAADRATNPYTLIILKILSFFTFAISIPKTILK